MKNYELKCQHCGQQFQSSRKDTKYCSDSCRVMASRDRKQETEENNGEMKPVTVEYSVTEYANILKIAESADITVGEMVKFRSLVPANYLEAKENEINALKKEITKLKAHLSLYIKKPADGIFLPVSKSDKTDISFQVEELRLLADEEDATLEDKIIWLALNCAFYISPEELPWQ